VKNVFSTYFADHILSSLETRGLRVDLLKMYRHLKGECKDIGARLFPVAPSDRTMHKLKHRKQVPPQCQERLVSCEVDWAVVQVAQRAAVVSFLGDLQSGLDVVCCKQLFVDLFEHKILTMWPPEAPSNLGHSVFLWFLETFLIRSSTITSCPF